MTDLIETLRHHRLWLAGDSEGKRANLRDADLTNANLRDADLTNANLTNANLTNADLRDARIPTGWCRWDVSVEGCRIHIGCQSRTRAEWDSFFDPACTSQLNTPRNSIEWRRIRAAYRAACTWLDEGGLDGLNVGEGASNG